MELTTAISRVTVIEPGRPPRIGRVVARTMRWVWIDAGEITRAFSIATGWERGVHRGGTERAARLSARGLERLRRNGDAIAVTRIEVAR